MGRRGFPDLEFGKMLKRAMWSVVVIEVPEAVEDAIDVFDVSGQVVAGVELIAPSASHIIAVPS